MPKNTSLEVVKEAASDLAAELSHHPVSKEIDAALDDLKGKVAVGKCKDCKHWDEHRDDGYGLCERIGLYNSFYDEPAQITEDNVVGETRLETSAEFGCTLHEPKENDGY